MVEGRPHIDAGFMDEAGIMALPGVPESKLVVNIVCSRNAITSSVLPDQYKDCRVSIRLVFMPHRSVNLLQICLFIHISTIHHRISYLYTPIYIPIHIYTSC